MRMDCVNLLVLQQSHLHPYFGGGGFGFVGGYSECGLGCGCGCGCDAGVSLMR